MGSIDFKKYADIIPLIEAREGAFESIPGWLASEGFRHVIAVQDVNTKKAAGERILSMLSEGSLHITVFTYGDENLHADEKAVEALLAALTPETELLLGIGSGTICDIVKFVGHKAGIPCAIAGTAPSMDGYASKGAAMTMGGMKVTPQTILPKAVFCDISVMREAPAAMLAAGLGDMLGKYTALADWELSHLLTGEPIPPHIYGQVKDALALCVESAPLLVKRGAVAVERLTEGLVLSGIAMSLYGDSRPASGSEHHLSHYWEMRSMAEGREPALHGLTVGAAALCVLSLYKSLPKVPKQPAKQDREKILALIKEKYGVSAENILKTENPNLPYEFILEKWPEILKIAGKLPEREEAAALLKAVSAPASPEEAGISESLLREGILLARERKKVYTVLQLLGDLGIEGCHIGLE